VLMLRRSRLSGELGGAVVTFRSAYIAALLVVPSFLVGCGLAVPDIKEPWDQDIPPGTLSPNQTTKWSGAAQLELEIKKRIYCELRDAVDAVNKIDYKVDNKPAKMLPDNWGVQVAISLEVDENSALTPGVSLNTPMHNGIVNFAGEYLGPATVAGGGLLTAVPATQFGALATPQSYAFGLGATLSSTASRIDQFDPYWSIGYLSAPEPPQTCSEDPFKGLNPVRSSPLTSDLGIRDWLVGAMMVNTLYPSDVDVPKSFSVASSSGKSKKSSGGSASGKQPDTVSVDIKFVIVTSGNVTPSWKLVRVSANNNAPFFSTGRTRTHEVIITIGPNNETSANTQLSSKIGQAVSAGNRTSLGTQ